MKRVLFVMLALAMVVTACAPKTVEVEKIVEKPVEVVKEVPAKVTHLRWLSEADVKVAGWLAQEYRKLTNGAVDVEVVFTQSPDGTTSEIQAMFAAGQPPDVYTAYGGRTSQYFDIAIPLTLEEDKYVPGLLDMHKNSKGEIVAVPAGYWVVGGRLNRTMLTAYDLWSYVPTDGTWSFAEFDKLMTAFEAKRKADEYGVFFYAASGSGDYWMQMWEKGWGGYPLYNNGKLDVNNPAMEKAWTWYKDMITRGLAPAGAEGLNDDHFLARFNDGKLLFCGGGAGDPNAVMVSYPSVDGSFVPLPVGPSSTIAISGYGKDAEVKAFVEWLSLAPQAKALLNTSGGDYAPRTDLPNPTPDCAGKEGDELAKCKITTEQYAFVEAGLKKGVMNMGIGSVQYQAVRKLRALKLAEMFAGKPVKQALAEFQAEGEALFK